MDPTNQGQISSTERVAEQVDVRPVSQPALPVSWGLQGWIPSERNIMQTGMQFPVPVNPYCMLSANNMIIQPGHNYSGQSLMPVHQGFDQLSTAKGQRSGSLPLLGVQSSKVVDNTPQPTALASKRPQQKTSPKFPYVTGIAPMNKNKRPAPVEQPSKVQNESFELVRSKLRESLAGALAAVGDKASKRQIVEKDSSQDRTSSTVEINKSEDAKTSVLHDNASNNPFPGNLVANEGATKHDIAESSKSNITFLEQSPCNTNGHNPQEVSPMPISLQDEVSNSNYFVKDELLQGHGLCWISDVASNSGSMEDLNNHEKKRLKLIDAEVTPPSKKEDTITNAENLALRIEEELFRLFGGVNKKYKEKGRSLLFNLKDRSNPELRERVLFGKISPERLCTMSVEELASKELSEWRLAKAEELAQMVVLPDREVDVRRLVRKTHKGEIQVEIEEADSVVMEVELGTNVQALVHSNSDDDSNELKVSAGVLPTKKVLSKEQKLSSNMDALQEKTDLMQELMVDEVKDPELLRPVVSLDEFMEALDSEPPFENLPADSVQDTSSLGTDIASNLGPEIVTPLVSSESEMNSYLDSSKDKTDIPTDSEPKLRSSKEVPSSLDLSGKPISDDDDKPSKLNVAHSSEVKSYSLTLDTDAPCHDISTTEKIWEGLVQLNISSIATVIAVYKSGEKTSTREWPTFLEIKGRVKLDAFEKFLQELPLSRSRAVMVAQFSWKEGSPVGGRANLHELYESYISDGRVGFAEPAAGVELYLSPLHPKMTEMLGKYLSKENTEALEPTADGFVGLVVWRRPFSSISPRVSSHHKHGSSTKQLSSRKQQSVGLQSVSPTVSRSSVMPSILGPPPTIAKPPSEDETDDVPPGFGPKDDDLPEFDFVDGSSQVSRLVTSKLAGEGKSLPHVLQPARPVEQIREMIHKYGQTELVKKPLIDVDDDDDIPEWQPHQQSQPQTQEPSPLPLVPPVPHLQISRQQNVVHFQETPDFVPVPCQQLTPHPYAQYHQFMPFQTTAPMPLQMPLQHQIGLIQSGHWNSPIGWQANPGLPMSGALVGVNVASNNNMQPPNFVGQNLSSQFYGMQNLGANPMYNGNWTADNNSRNGGS